MHTLTRRVRFTVNPRDAGGGGEGGGSGYAGTPSPVGLSAFYECAVTVRGEPDPWTGYLLDIKVIDDAARAVVAPALAGAARSGAGQPGSVADTLARDDDPARWLPGAADALASRLPGLDSIRFFLSPFLSYEVRMNAAPHSPSRVILRQRFDFAAAHRLHVPTLSDEQNRALFGKCNNPRGHGHNYQFEPAIAVPGGKPLAVGAVAEVCERAILDRFDHMHLNEDCAEFDTSRGGVNPSVENIAKVFFDRLAPEVARLGGASLVAVTVWETDRTSATYPA